MLLSSCSNPPAERLDAFAIVKYPLTTESAMKKIEDNNTLVSNYLREHASSRRHPILCAPVATEAHS